MEVWIFFGMIIAGVVAYSIITDKVNYEKRAIADAATAKKVKQAITGNGNADKTQLQYMIKQIFKLKQLPTPLDAEGSENVYISRIRKGLSSDKIVNFWVVGDNLLKGAALNTVQIGNHLLNL